MRVRVLLFAQLRERAGAGDVWREMTRGASVADLLAVMESEGVLPAVLGASCAVAVNREYVGRDFLLSDGDELAVLPPVSGGSR